MKYLPFKNIIVSGNTDFNPNVREESVLIQIETHIYRDPRALPESVLS